MKERKNFNVRLLLNLRHFNLRQLGAALVIGNALYFSYSTYFHHDISSETFAIPHDQSDNIQLIK
ncbi:hypothetical protein A7A69_09965 [Acinetobacter sp. Ac_1271]|nr:hypothetical protein [Acinetobacter guerrae]